MRRFENKVVAVTGAASGLGRAVAVRVAAEGGRVHGVDIDEAGLRATAALVADADGPMTFTTDDISTRAACHGAVDDAVAAHGGLDALVNSAAIARAQPALSVTEEDWDSMMAINLAGTFFMCQAALPHLLDRAGAIVNVASNAALMGQAYTTPYCASKGAVVQVTRALAMEFIKSDVRINAIAPGGMDTPLTQNFELFEGVDYSLMGRYTAIRGMADADRVAATVLFLASDDALDVHGAIWSVDRGVTTG